MQESFLNIVLTIVIGILIAGFIGLGISAFYSAPERPSHSENILTPGSSLFDSSDSQIEELKNVITDNNNYKSANDRYSRTVSVISLIAAIWILLIVLAFFQKASLLKNGLLLGSAIVLLYSIWRSIVGGGIVLQFVTVAVGIAAILGFSYFISIKLVRIPEISSQQKKSFIGGVDNSLTIAGIGLLVTAILVATGPTATSFMIALPLLLLALFFYLVVVILVGIISLVRARIKRATLKPHILTIGIGLLLLLVEFAIFFFWRLPGPMAY